MAVVYQLDPRPHPRLTQEVLMGVSDVLEAVAWRTGDRLLARVVVTTDAMLSPSDLQYACFEKLGAPGTPSLLMIERQDHETTERVA